MIPLPREMCRSVPFPGELRFDARPLQLGLGGSPWHVAVASVLLCRTRRVQVDVVLQELFNRWPIPQLLAIAEGLEPVVQPCGLHMQRARQLQRMSFHWHLDTWEDLRNLPGVGKYVADAVGLFCFGCTELESKDPALHKHAEVLRVSNGVVQQS